MKDIAAELFYYPSLELSEFTKRHERMKKQLINTLENSEDDFGLFDAMEREVDVLADNTTINFEDASDYYY